MPAGKYWHESAAQPKSPLAITRPKPALEAAVDRGLDLQVQLVRQRRELDEALSENILLRSRLEAADVRLDALEEVRAGWETRCTGAELKVAGLVLREAELTDELEAVIEACRG